MTNTDMLLMIQILDLVEADSVVDLMDSEDLAVMELYWWIRRYL